MVGEGTPRVRGALELAALFTRRRSCGHSDGDVLSDLKSLQDFLQEVPMHLHYP
jgi:hypothetical protein